MWNQKWLVLAIVGGAALLGLAISLVQSPVYESQVRVGLIDPNTAGRLTNQMGLDRSQPRHVANQAIVMTSPELAIDTASALGGSFDADEIEGALSATAQREADLIVLGAGADSSTDASAIVTAAIESYRSSMLALATTAWEELTASHNERIAELEAEMEAYDERIRVQPNTASLRNQQANLGTEIRLIRQDQALIDQQLAAYGDGVASVSEATEPADPSSPDPARNMLIAVVVGFLIALGVAWVRS